jgi:hypothetical protein
VNIQADMIRDAIACRSSGLDLVGALFGVWQPGFRRGFVASIGASNSEE